jgi:nicotinic acid mononucleotide adenylyltransferase
MVELAVQNLPGVPHESKQEPTSLRKERGVSVGLEASPIDAPRSDGQPNYSVDTLGRLREQYPEAEIYFLLGADAFAGLRRWRDPELLLQQCELAVASRPGFELPLDGNDLLEWMPVGTRFLGLEEVRVRDQGPGTRHQQAEPEAAGSTVEARVFLAGSALVRLFLLDDLAEDIAATELRALLARGEGYDWLPGGAEGAVAQYIREHRLYGLNPPAA